MDASEPVGPSQPVLYEELLEVVTRAVAKLDLDWPVEQQKQRTPSPDSLRLGGGGTPHVTVPFPPLHHRGARPLALPQDVLQSTAPCQRAPPSASVLNLSTDGGGPLPLRRHQRPQHIAPAIRVMETGLPTLPQGESQGTASLQRFAPHLSTRRFVVGGEGPPPLARHHQLQGVAPAALSGSEASPEGLVPLRNFLTAWEELPGVSRWVLQTIVDGYTVQFASSPPRFNGMCPTLVGPEQALVLEREVRTLLGKGAIEVVPPSARESGFYSPYFVFPKKDGRWRPILDLRSLNRSLRRLRFRMLTLKEVVTQIRSGDWFVTIDLEDTYFHISILPAHRRFLSFAFGGKAYQYRVLPFGLALLPRTFTKCIDAALTPLRLQGIRILNYLDDWLILAQSERQAVRHRDVLLACMKVLGFRLNAGKSVLSPAQRTTFLGIIWDSARMQARLSPARVVVILNSVGRVREGQPLTVKPKVCGAAHVSRGT
ncbi:uncharacterized protein LOC116675969, partial [Tachysurus ichikawai]